MTIDEAYLILGIENRNISMDELRRIYYQAVHLSHPDNNPQNHYAQSKFAMIQEAYLILKGEIKAGKIIKEEYRQQTGHATEQQTNKQSTGKKDRWDYYNDADRKYRQMRNEESKRNLHAAFEAHRRAAQTVHPKQKEPAATTASQLQSFDSVATNVSNYWRLFLGTNVIFDCMLICSVAMLLMTELFASQFGMRGMVRVLFVSMIWIFSVLSSRKLAAFVNRFVNMPLWTVVIFLTGIEIQVELFKLFLL